VAANLAVTAAFTRARRVLLVDANVATPTLHESFELERGPGLVEAVLDEFSPRLCLQRSEEHNLSVLAAGNLRETPTRVFDMNLRLARVVAELTQAFDLIVIDTPPLAECSSVLGLLRIVDGVAFVVEAEGARWHMVKRTRDALVQSGVKLAGAVLNKRPDHVPGWLYRLV
jgi:tyrosine-protein kinase Etk/Wzc